ncbi:hypothetical protein D3C86_2068950 [compost metagenome]
MPQCLQVFAQLAADQAGAADDDDFHGRLSVAVSAAFIKHPLNGNVGRTHAWTDRWSEVRAPSGINRVSLL